MAKYGKRKYGNFRYGDRNPIVKQLIDLRASAERADMKHQEMTNG